MQHTIYEECTEGKYGVGINSTVFALHMYGIGTTTIREIKEHEPTQIQALYISYFRPAVHVGDHSVPLY
jgi:hypothetical protein